MKKFITIVLYLMYSYYEDGKGERNVPYLTAILVFLLILFFNLLIIFKLFDVDINILPWVVNSDNKPVAYLKFFFYYFLPGYLIMKNIFKEKDVKNINFDEDKKVKYQLILATYFIFTVITFIIIAFVKKA